MNALTNISIDKLHCRCKALAVCEVLVQGKPRQFSYIDKWRPGFSRGCFNLEQGDEARLYFSAEGALVKGFAHESDMSPRARFSPLRGKLDEDGVWPGLFHGIPPSLSIVLDDPDFDRLSTTFCYWRLVSHPKWNSGARDIPEGKDPDGSRDVLEPYIFNSTNVIWWLQEYYDLTPTCTATVAPLLAGAPVDGDILAAFGQAPTPELLNELRTINWPYVAS